tara:strand:+ start:4445 stop:5731 length:1287 start_codon:yes stop_codon:yes gene_type:complete
MAVNRGLSFLSNFVQKSIRRVDGALDSLKDKVVAARVIDISLNSDSTLYSQTGEWQGIGTIQFQVVDSPTSDESISSSKLNLAKPLFPQIKNYPLVNEIVLLIKLPNKSSIANISGATTYYYFTPLSIWNHPEQNAYPNPLVSQNSDSQKSDYQQIEAGNTRKVSDESSEIDLNGASGGTFIENGNIHPILPFAGDNILEGRFGNSIRLGNTSKIDGSIKNNWSEEGEDGNPISIIRNGQDPDLEPPGWVPTTEDINKDLSSIYLTSNQKIPIEISKFTTDSIKNKPEEPEQYVSNQVILNSGRLVFNTNIDSILLSSQKSILLNSNEEIGLDATNAVTIVAPKINLGDLEAEQSLVLGDDFMTQFDILLQNISNLAVALQSSLDWPGGAPVPSPSIPPIASTVQSQITKIQQVVKKGSLVSKVSKTI